MFFDMLGDLSLNFMPLESFLGDSESLLDHFFLHVNHFEALWGEGEFFD